MRAREETNTGEERREVQGRKRTQQNISQRAPDKRFNVMEAVIPPAFPLPIHIHYPFILFYLKSLIWWWCIADSQCCDSFRWTARDSAIDIHVSILPEIPLPSRLPHNIEQSPMCYTVDSGWLSMLNISVCTCPSQTPLLSPSPHSSPWQPQGHSLSLRLSLLWVHLHHFLSDFTYKDIIWYFSFSVWLHSV